MILLAIILLPLEYQFSALAKLRQFSHFSQQIDKSASRPFLIIQTRAPSLFPFVRCWNLHKSKTPIKYDWEGRWADLSTSPRLASSIGKNKTKKEESWMKGREGIKHVNCI